ncbi:MAG: hypothetical protein PHX60_14910 [Giesbergeria sp.]|uniref:hypothetical protein n=1 Tax=Giesbergeria sp. TaxID=2818473 RepID=UPI00261946A6|nr:hypothetical protein [Giesbergeria sp.]MDD2610944.1 hypothetical protein [Giesbergeria sp.]
MKDNQSKHFDEAHLLRQQFAQYPGGAFEQALGSDGSCQNVVVRQLAQRLSAIFCSTHTTQLSPVS